MNFVLKLQSYGKTCEVPKENLFFFALMSESKKKSVTLWLTKKIHIYYFMKCVYFTILSALLLLEACHNAPSPQDQPVSNSAEQPVQSAKKRNIVKRSISIPQDFSYITNLGSIDIIYTQGNFKVEVEGDSSTLNFLHTDFDSNLLTVSIGNDGNTDYNFYGNTSNVKMYVSCPDLKCVSICGNGSFESQATWHTEDLQLGVLGTGSLKTGKVECTTFSIQSSDTGPINIGELQAEDATVFSRSSARIDLNVNVNNLTVLNEGSQTLTLTGSAHKVYIKNTKDPKLTNKIARRP